ncbi:hypothetical protein SAMN04488061_3254 [Filomicrobium insigne]|uniref:Peptidase C-terminal archaeal/bacterial domain-containing protein n=1 Tax=Filomicrobium insigne TaxID=418854 RepID=A0A1H0TC04_9HYPH|nr:PPC domain-containing protein [Filomicrobium insigne]SDP51539.1 hypothetical protein SAMN04488061_3254 [Filomicrobium insigne]
MPEEEQTTRIRKKRLRLGSFGQVVAVASSLFAMALLYLGYDLLRTNLTPCEAIFQQTSVGLATKVSFLKTEGELKIGREQLTELDERAQMTAINLKTCCTVLDAGRLDPEQFLQCKANARDYESRVEDIVALVRTAMQATDTPSSSPITPTAAAASPTNTATSTSKQQVDQAIAKKVSEARQASKTFNHQVVEVRKEQALQSLEAVPPRHIEIDARESEPNNDSLSTNQLGLKTWVAASIDPPKDADFFTFTTPAEYRDWIRVEIENRSTTLEPRIELFDAEKTSLGSVHKTTAGADIVYTFVATPDTRYAARVSNHYGNSVGVYNVRVVPTKSYDAFEPNDGLLTAKPINIGEGIEAAIMGPADSDFFSFEIPEGRAETEIRLENRSTTLRPAIVIYDPAKSQISATYNTTGGADVTQAFKSAQPGRYLIQVYDHYRSAAGAYTIHISSK